MSKIVFFCIPAYGHLHPTLSVVQELIQRGHEVFYYCHTIMAEKIKATGATFIAYDQYDPENKLMPHEKNKIGKDLAFSVGLIVDLTLALDEHLLSDMQALKPDVIVGDSMAYWSKLIAKKLGVPFISSTTTFAFNRQVAKLMQPKGPGFFQILKSMPSIGKSLSQLRKKGYEVKNVLDIIQNDNATKTLVYTSSFFQPYAETFSENYHFIGPILRKPTQTFKKSDIPTIFISLGTVDNAQADFYKLCFEALKDSPYHVILAIGETLDKAELGEIPKNFSVYSYVDQIAVLQVTDVFLTHCGMNSVSEALYFGIPLLLYPQTPEQYAVAVRVANLNAGKLLETLSPTALKTGIQDLLSDTTFKTGALHIQDSFFKAGGISEAVTFIERTAQAVKA